MKHLMHTVAVGVVAFAAMQGAALAEDIKIGVLYPIAGTGAVYGVPAMHGHDMAVDELNKAGGILGKNVVTVARDTKLNPAAASAAAKELITKEGVDVLVGGLSSAVGLAISEVAKQEKVVYVATIPKTIQMTTTKRHDYVFRTASNTDFEGAAMAKVAGELGLKKLCQIQYDYAYGHDLAAGVEKALPKYAPGAEIVLDLKVKLGTNDLNAYITQLMGADCEGVMSGLWGNGFINMAKQGAPFGLFNKIKYISGGEIASHEIAGKLKGDYPDNVWSNTYELWYDHSHSPLHEPFYDELAKRSGTEETAMWPVLAYTGVKFIAAAAEKAGAMDSDKLSAALKGLTIDTPAGPRTIDPETHQADTGQFWGPMKKVEGRAYRMMDPITYVPAE